MSQGAQLVKGEMGNWLRGPKTLPDEAVDKALAILKKFTAATARCASATILRLGHGKLGGDRQTVPAGELAVMTAALRE